MGISGYTDAVGTAAQFNFPVGVAADPKGYLYVADSQNMVIRRVDLQTAAVVTWAGQWNTPDSSDGARLSATFNIPFGLCLDGSGNLYIADQANALIRRISAAGEVSTLSNGAPPVTEDDPDPVGVFYSPSGVAVSTSGQVYVANSLNHTIQQISPEGAVTLLAGTTGVSGHADGARLTAQFNNPMGLALDPIGRLLFVADTDNHLIRQIDLATGWVSTLAGTSSPELGRNAYGQADGIGKAASFYGPTGLAVDGFGNVYVADTNNHLIRQITLHGGVSTLAGTSVNDGGYQDGVGIAAEFNLPTGIALDPSGNLWVADSQNHLIRRITPKF